MPNSRACPSAILMFQTTGNWKVRIWNWSQCQHERQKVELSLSTTERRSSKRSRRLALFILMWRWMTKFKPRSLCTQQRTLVKLVWNVMARGCVWKQEVRGTRRMEWVTQLLKRRGRSNLPSVTRRCEHLAFERLSGLTPPPIRMDWSYSLKDEN
jgi:hypothetical protein